jgi:energy-coupling factor transporter transmembrane protein EcfT
LYVAFGGFLAIALIWAFILFGIMRFGFKVKFKFVVLILFFFAAISLVILIAGAAFEYIEQPEFCGTTCHPRANVIVDDAPMDPFYQGYVSPGNNTMMAVHNENEVYCSGCHDKPGLLGKAEGAVMLVVRIV